MNKVELEGVIKEKFAALRNAIDKGEAEAIKMIEKEVKSAAGKSRKELEVLKKGAFELKKLVQEFKAILSGVDEDEDK